MICSGPVERHVPLDFDDNFQGWVYDLEDYRFIDRSLGMNQDRLTKAENFMFKLAKVCGYDPSYDCCSENKNDSACDGEIK